MTIQQGWFEVAEIGAGVWSISEPGHVEYVYSYLIEGERDLAILDTGMSVGDFAGLVREISDRVPLVIQSHAHWDHIGASWQFDRVLVHPTEREALAAGYPNEKLRPWFNEDELTGIPLPASFDINTAEIPGATASGELHDGQLIDLGNRQIELTHTPGHSPGGMTILDRTSRLLFPGDAANYGPIYLDGEDADPIAYRNTVKQLAALSSEAGLVYPSHYDVPMQPSDLLELEQAYEEVMAGREPDEQTPEHLSYRIGRFEFLIAPGALGTEER